MRNTFCKTLQSLAIKDKRIMLLTADLGYSAFEEFIETLPQQYINMGVAEQNMTGSGGRTSDGRIYSCYIFDRSLCYYEKF